MDIQIYHFVSFWARQMLFTSKWGRIWWGIEWNALVWPMDEIFSLRPRFSFDSYMILEFQALSTCWPNVQWQSCHFLPRDPCYSYQDCPAGHYCNRAKISVRVYLWVSVVTSIRKCDVLWCCNISPLCNENWPLQSFWDPLVASFDYTVRHCRWWVG